MRFYDMARFVGKIPNYISRFGMLPGTKLFLQIEAGLRGESVIVPGLDEPVHLRHSLSDRSIFWQCFVNRQYDIDRFPHSRRLENVYEKLIEEGKVPLIIDCGANIGLSALVFLSRFPKARICAVEPDKENVDMLHKNVAHFAERVEIFQGAIWPTREDKLKIVNPNAGSAAFRVGKVMGEEKDLLRGYTIDELCGSVDDSVPFIVKLDIEGAQRWLFSENYGWVGRVHLLILELDDWLFPWQGTSRTFFSAVSDYPFEYVLGGENIFCFRDFLSTD